MEYNLTYQNQAYQVNYRLLSIIIWFCLIFSGVGLGAKLFDLIILAGAWGASPPDSLKHLPYGEFFHLNPGDFFMPVTALLLFGSIAALIVGRKTPINFRKWLVIPVFGVVIISIFTPLIFWPMINELYAIKTGTVILNSDEMTALVSKWKILDWFRTIFAAMGFVSYIRAISMPINAKAI